MAEPVNLKERYWRSHTVCMDQIIQAHGVDDKER